MTILFTKHALIRIRDRRFDKKAVEDIVKNPTELFFDTKTKSLVAISSCLYITRFRLIAVFYHIDKYNNKIIRTFHPEIYKEIEKRIIKGRYIKVT